MLVCVCLMSFIHTEEWTCIVIYPTLLIYWMLVCVFYDSHFHTWIRLYLYCYIPISVQWMIILWWYHLFMWFKFWHQIQIEKSNNKNKVCLIFCCILKMRWILWLIKTVYGAHLSNPTDECEKRQTKCEWYFAHLNEDLMSELSRSPVVLRL